MKVKIYPSTLDGTIEAIPSKSMAHRILIAAFLSDGKTKVKLKSASKDIDATIFCLTQLGGTAEREGENLIITPIANNPHKQRILNCGESGSTLRFLVPVVGALGSGATFIGEGRLPDRPIKELIGIMKGLSFNETALPVSMEGKLLSGEYEIRGDVSSQYVTGLMMALPILNGDSRIVLTTPLQSASYVNMTIEVLKLFGIEVVKEENGWFIKGNQKYITPGYIEVEGDWSNGGVWIAASAIGNMVRVKGLSSTSAQGDKAIKDILLSFRSSGTVIDATDIPDLVPILAGVACYADSQTKIINAERLRLKESDRLKSVSATLNSMGGEVKETETGLIVEGKGGLDGGEVDSFNDHRIVMLAAIMATQCKNPTIINGAEAVEKSYPGFFEDFKSLGGKIDVL